MDNINYREYKVHPDFFNMIMEEARKNRCYVVFYDESGDGLEDFIQGVEKLALKCSNHVTLYRTTDGSGVFATDYHLDPYKNLTIASASDKLKDRVRRIIDDYGIFYDVNELIDHMTAFDPSKCHFLENLSEEELLINIENAANIIDLNDEATSTTEDAPPVGVITIRRFGKDRLHCIRGLESNDIHCIQDEDLGDLKVGDHVTYEVNENDEAVDLMKFEKTSVALHPSLKGGQEIKLQILKEKHLDELAKFSNTGIFGHALITNHSDLNQDQIAAVKSALINVANRNMKDGLSTGTNIPEFAAWASSNCMGNTADYLMENVGDRNKLETYKFAFDKLQSCLLDYYRTEANSANYPETLYFWEDLVYGQRVLGGLQGSVADVAQGSDEDFYSIYVKTPEDVTEQKAQEIGDKLAVEVSLGYNFYNIYTKDIIKANEAAEIIGQNRVVEIA